MRYFRFTSDCGYCGCDIDDYFEYPDNVTEEELLADVDDFARESQAGYEYLATEDISSDDYDTEEEYQQAIDDACEWFWADVSATYEEITKEEYDEYFR